MLLLSLAAAVAPALLAPAPAAAQVSWPKCDFKIMGRPLKVPATVDWHTRGKACVQGGDGPLFYHMGNMYRFQIDAASGVTPVEFSMTSDDIAPGLWLHDSAGNVLARSVSNQRYGGRVKRTTVRLRLALRPGRYLLGAGDGPMPAKETMDKQNPRRYRLEASRIGETQPVHTKLGGPCSPHTSRIRDSLTAGGRLRGEFAVTDCFFEDGTHGHYYKVRVPTRRTLQVRATGSPAPEVDLLDPDGSNAAFGEDADTTDQGVQTEVDAGFYYVVVKSPEDEEGKGDRKPATYGLAVQTVGTPSDDADTHGAVCTGAREPLTIGGEKRGGVLTSESCRSREGKTYHAYDLVVGSEQRIVLTMSAYGDVVPAISIVADGKELGSVRGDAKDREARFAGTFQPGTYRVYALDEHGGRGGSFYLGARRMP